MSGWRRMDPAVKSAPHPPHRLAKVQTRKPLLKTILPELCAELDRDLRAQGEHSLANGVDYLRVYGLCECSADSCGSFYTAERPNGKYGEGHRCVMLNPATGMTILDVVDDVIKFVELIDRPTINAALRDAGTSGG